jgi:hypothetical protein
VAWSIPWNLLGTWVSGDLGGYTIYTDRFGRKNVFEKSPPEKPPTPAQIHQRARFKQAQAAWRALTPQERDNLETATRRLSIPMTGQNLYLKAALRNMDSAVRTVERQSGIPLPTVPYIA